MLGDGTEMSHDASVTLSYIGNAIIMDKTEMN